MAAVLVDSSVLLDVLTEDLRWFGWSSAALARCAENHILVINPIVYSEISVRFETIEDLESAFPSTMFERREIPWEAAFLAGKCFLRYRRGGGRKTAPLPDFFIGAHAAIEGLALLTRDPSRVRAYFPSVKLIEP
jgi:predicted nucleic acid-binding protein